MTLTGSIGVYMIRFDLSGACKKIGVSVEHQTTGPFAGLDNPLHPLTPAMQKVLTSETNHIYEEFKDRVAKGCLAIGS